MDESNQLQGICPNGYPNQLLQQRKEVSALLGTSVLEHIPTFGALLPRKTDNEPRTSGTCTSNFVQVAGNYLS